MSDEKLSTVADTEFPKLLNEKQAADVLSCSVAYLRKCRLFKTGPQYVKVGSLVRYDRNDLTQFVMANKQLTEAA